MRASVRAMTRKSRSRRASTATLILRDHVRHRDHAPVRRVAALLRELLVLDLDRADAGLLVAAHRVAHVEQAAEAGVGVGDHRRLRTSRRFRDALDHFGVGRDARVGQAEVGGGEPVAGHVHRVEADALGDHGRDHVEDAGGDDEFAALELLTESGICHGNTGRWSRMERWGNIADMRNSFIARASFVLIPALSIALVAPMALPAEGPSTAAAPLQPAAVVQPAPAPAVPAAPLPAPAGGNPARQELGNLVLDGVPPHDPAIAAKLDDWLAGRAASFRDFLPDGGVLVSTRFGEVEQLHRVAMPLGAREQVTFYPEPVGTAVAPQTPDAAGFAFLKDRGGDENAQVHWYRFADRSVRMLTDGRSLHGGLAWSRDGERLAFHGNGRDGVSYDIYVADVGAAPRRAS